LTESLVDTDILSFYFKGDTKVAESFTKYLQLFDQVNISIITYFEIIGGLTYKQAQKQLGDFENFVRNNNIIHITEASAKISGNIYASLRQQGITIGTSDLLIAGIALENDLALITNNEKHYAAIPGIRIENWKL
jgi:tRNA(fMet)-specific endonuclease VapC